VYSRAEHWSGGAPERSTGQRESGDARNVSTCRVWGARDERARADSNIVHVKDQSWVCYHLTPVLIYGPLYGSAQYRSPQYRSPQYRSPQHTFSFLISQQMSDCHQPRTLSLKSRRCVSRPRRLHLGQARASFQSDSGAPASPVVPSQSRHGDYAFRVLADSWSPFSSSPFTSRSIMIRSSSSHSVSLSSALLGVFL